MPQERQLWVVSRDGSQSRMLYEDTCQDQSSCFTRYAFDPAGGRVAFFDTQVKPLIIDIAEGSVPAPLTVFPEWWMDYFYPHVS